MGWIVTCACGHTVRAEDESGVVVEFTDHLLDSHPDLAGSMSPADIRSMAGRV